jgi:hypothetical protein
LSVNYNSSIVTSGLVLALDAANPRSYPGSGTTWRDVGGTFSPSTLVNGPTYTSTSPGFFTFDGVDDYGTVQNTTLGNGNLAWTCSAWVRTTTAANALGAGSVLSNASSGPVYSMMGVNNGKIVYWTYQSAAWSQKLGVATVNDNIWHMLTWVNYTNSTMDMYVDGVLDTNVANSTSGNNNPIDRLGGSWAASFAGSISQILIYQSVSLSAAQVLQNFNTARGRYGR